MRGNVLIESVVAVLREVGGYFVLVDGDEEYVVINKRDFEQMRGGLEDEVQLELPSTEEAMARDDSDVLERINRDIAMFGSQHEEQDSEIIEEEAKEEAPARVRFEPLRGDISPELQE